MDKLPYNREIRDLLVDLADLNPIVGPNELVALWFDTLYFPAQAYISAESQDEWRSCFNGIELAALANFHQVFDAAFDELQIESPDWRGNFSWKTVSSAAYKALREIDAGA